MLFTPYLRVVPDPILRTPALPVKSFDDHLQAKIEEMDKIMASYQGQGIAANQVGLLESIAIISSLGPLTNIKIWPINQEQTNWDEEGCLSLPGLILEVERYNNIVIEAQRPDGETIKEELEGHMARVAQHEADHLNGVLIIDRVSVEIRRQLIIDLAATLPEKEAD